jgi:hypothetical protein
LTDSCRSGIIKTATILEERLPEQALHDALYNQLITPYFRSLLTKIYIHVSFLLLMKETKQLVVICCGKESANGICKVPFLF